MKKTRYIILIAILLIISLSLIMMGAYSFVKNQDPVIYNFCFIIGAILFLIAIAIILVKYVLPPQGDKKTS